MCSGCSSLLSIDLTRFNNSKLQSVRWAFKGCSSLKSLDLSYFYTSEVTMMNSMVSGCTKLEYIDMKNFDDSKVSSEHKNEIFKGVPENIVVCINENINQNIIIPQLKEKKCYNIDCSDNWKSNQKNIIFQF